MMRRMGETMTPTLFAQGLELLLYGMGTVVVFLTLLVFATQGMSALILRFFPEATAAAASLTRSAGKPGEAEPSPEVIAVIAAALHKHRNRRPPEQ